MASHSGQVRRCLPSSPVVTHPLYSATARSGSGKYVWSGRPRADAADLVDADAGEEPGRRALRRELHVRLTQDRVELLEELGPPALGDSRGSGDGKVGPHPGAGPAERHDRDGDAGIVADVAHLLVFGEVRGDEFVSVGRRLQRHPNQTHLGAAVGIEGDQGAVGTLADEVARGVVELHACLYRRGRRFIPGRFGLNEILSVVHDMTDHQQPTGIEHLRRELLDRLDATPFDDWSPALLRALIAVFDLNGVTPAARHGFRPYLVR